MNRKKQYNYGITYIRLSGWVRTGTSIGITLLTSTRSFLFSPLFVRSVKLVELRLLQFNTAGKTRGKNPSLAQTHCAFVKFISIDIAATIER
jgi:hypothetical protein